MICRLSISSLSLMLILPYSLMVITDFDSIAFHPFHVSFYNRCYSLTIRFLDVTIFQPIHLFPYLKAKSQPFFKKNFLIFLFNQKIVPDLSENHKKSGAIFLRSRYCLTVAMNPQISNQVRFILVEMLC